MEIFKADADLLASLNTNRGRGKKLYPFDQLEVGEAFFAPIDAYRANNGASRSCFDLQNSITACSHTHKPKRFAKRTRKDESGNAIGVDVVRVA